MPNPNDYPPIDTELRETVWPELLQKKAEMEPLSQAEFQEVISGAVDMWDADLNLDGAVTLEERTIRGANGKAELPVLIIRSANSKGGARPCIYYTANGGKMQQTARVGMSAEESKWVVEFDLVFISISPRAGPKHRHPAQVEDAYAGLVWIVEHARELGIDLARIMVMGKSGGGGVAAATALYARDKGGPALSHQILIYPMLEDRMKYAASHYDVPPWTAKNNQAGWAAILGDSVGGSDVSPYAAAGRATDLSGLPATYLEAGSCEVFRDEMLDYALRAAQAGVPVEVHSWEGGFHAFEIFAPETEISRACLAARTSYVRRALRATEPHG